MPAPDLSAHPEYESLLYREMKICAEFLHCTYEQWRALPKVERIRWLMFYNAKIVQENAFARQREQAARAQRAQVPRLVPTGRGR